MLNFYNLPRYIIQKSDWQVKEGYDLPFQQIQLLSQQIIKIQRELAILFIKQKDFRQLLKIPTCG